jgi:hypothetical protein
MLSTVLHVTIVDSDTANTLAASKIFTHIGYIDKYESFFNSCYPILDNSDN